MLYLQSGRIYNTISVHLPEELLTVFSRSDVIGGAHSPTARLIWGRGLCFAYKLLMQSGEFAELSPLERLAMGAE